MSNQARICFDNMAADATPTASHDQSGTAELVDGMASSKWLPANAAPTISYAGTFTDVDYIGLAGVNWQTAGCSLIVRDAMGGNILASFSGLGDSQPALAIITQTSETVIYFEFTCDNTLLEVGEIYFGQSIVLPRKVEVGYKPARWSNDDLMPTSSDERNQSAPSIVKLRGSTERLTLKYLDITFMEGVFKSFIRMAEGLPIFFIWDTLQGTHAIYGMWEVSKPSYISANYSSISMTIKGITEIVYDTGQSGSEGGNSGGFAGTGESFVQGGYEDANGSNKFWFRTSVRINNAIDFWTLDETSGSLAANIGNGGTGFTKEDLDYNPSAVGSSVSSISNGVGMAKDLATLTARTLSGSTINSGTVFARSNTWGIEFALDLNVTLVDDIVLSFWDSTAVTTAGVDFLMKVSVDASDADILNLILYTTDNDTSFTLRTNVIVPSIIALQSGYSYYSIFFISGDTLICRINNVETLNVDISSWQARLSGVHATAKFRIGCDKDSPTTNVMDGKIDEISTYASVSGVNFDTTRTYEWWNDIGGPSMYDARLISYWEFENPSAPATDLIGNHNLSNTFSGTILFGTGANGSGTSLLTAASGESYNAGSSTDFDMPNKDFTIIFSLNYNVETSTTKYILRMTDSDTPSIRQWDIYLDTFANPNKMQMRNSSGNIQHNITVANPNTWYRIALSLNDSTRVMGVYLDGSTTGNHGAMWSGTDAAYNSSSILYIASGSTQDTTIFPGLIDGIKIYDSVLTDQDILDEFNNY